MRDWPTLVLILGCYGLWAAITAGNLPLPLAVALVAMLVALQSSLQHEVLHGHPFRTRWMNEALVFFSLNLAIPFERFRDTHLAHHRDNLLTDPYDDPESNYMDPLVWDRTPAPVRAVLARNNTLVGRLIFGPLVAQVRFMQDDLQLIRAGEPGVLRAWLLHALGVAGIVAWLATFGTMPWWAYAIAAYAGLSILKLRTFLEHQAHDSARGRTVVIEDRGLFAFLFLNNNYHVVHHMHPKVAWFKLPGLFRANREKYLRRNHGYYYRSYAAVIARHLFRPKDPVAHPLWRGDQRQTPLPARYRRRSGDAPAAH